MYHQEPERSGHQCPVWTTAFQDPRPANMASVINEDLAMWLAKNGYYYVMHRFEPETRKDFIKDMHKHGLFA